MPPLAARRLRVLLALLAAVLVVAGAAALLGPRPAPPLEAGEAPQGLSAIVARGEPYPRYWELPIAPQGAPPDRFTDREASLVPETCAQCHPSQFAGWQGSLHARAMSPGLRGQLLDLLVQDPASALECLTCHAPLAEQRPLAVQADGRFTANPLFREPLLQSGITCAACHVRAHRRFGPPALPDNPNTRYPPGLPDHGGVTRSAAFERAEFCAVCHQFDRAAAINGKPLQNTYEEWRQSDWGRRGIACQACHMPGRQHLWRGVHDPEMVRGALIADLVLDDAPDPGRVRLELAHVRDAERPHRPRVRHDSRRVQVGRRVRAELAHVRHAEGACRGGRGDDPYRCGLAIGANHLRRDVRGGRRAPGRCTRPRTGLRYVLRPVAWRGAWGSEMGERIGGRRLRIGELAALTTGERDPEARARTARATVRA